MIEFMTIFTKRSCVEHGNRRLCNLNTREIPLILLHYLKQSPRQTFLQCSLSHRSQEPFFIGCAFANQSASLLNLLWSLILKDVSYRRKDS